MTAKAEVQESDCPHRDAITTGHYGFLNCLDCHTEIPDLWPGQVWERADGSRLRVEGFSKTDFGWIKTREVGGDRERMSYPRTPFYSGALTRVSLDRPTDQLRKEGT